jgi:ABC-type phosphate/phosphonate transport system substrate-binding protein
LFRAILMFLAGLSWYDLPEIRAANDALWCALAKQLKHFGLNGVPTQLDRTTPYPRQWTSGRLIFGQACGYDVLIAFPKHLQLVATPRYAAPGCDGHTYCSYVVVRDGSPYRELADLRHGRCVINTPTSHSGMNVLRCLVAPLHHRGRFFASVRLSGSHEASLNLLARGAADVAAIDCVTHALLRQHRPHLLRGTRVLCRTPNVPAPPFVTSSSTSSELVQRLRTALREAISQPDLSASMERLFLTGIDFLPLSAYQPIADHHNTAHHHGYLELPRLAFA